VPSLGLIKIIHPGQDYYNENSSFAFAECAGAQLRAIVVVRDRGFPGRAKDERIARMKKIEIKN
jgi:hypothetical protein